MILKCREKCLAAMFRNRYIRQTESALFAYNLN